MGLNKLYRTFLAAVLGIAALQAVGCEQLDANHKKMVETARSHGQFDLMRLQLTYEVAEEQYKTGELDKCRESLKSTLAVPTPYAPLHVLAAKVELEDGGSLEVAAAELKKAIEIKGDEAEAYYLLGVVYQRWQKLETAAGYYQQAVDHKPSEASYVLAVAEMKISLGQLDDAQRLLEDKIMYFEQSPAIHVAMAKISTLKGNHAEAASHLRDATLLQPEDQQIRWSYASALFDAGKFADASKILEEMRNDPPTLPKSPTALTKGEDEATDKAAAKSSKTTLLMMLGDCYISLRRPIDARDCFQEVLRGEPENMSAYLSLGKASMLTNDFNLTLAAAKRVLRNDPDNVQAMILEALVQQKQKKWSDSLSTLSTASRLLPNDSTVLCMQGVSQMQLGQTDRAIATLEKAVSVNPKDAWAGELLDKAKSTNSVSNAAAPVPEIQVP